MSMTGFARGDGGLDRLSWVWEARSVNGRALDLRLRLPPGMESLEQPVRERCAGRLSRGNVSINLSVTRYPGTSRVVINRPVLDQILRVMGELRGEFGAEPLRLDALMAIKGVVETIEETEDDAARQDREAVMIESFDQTLGALLAMRAREGRALAKVLGGHLDEIEEMRGRAAACAAAQPEALRARLEKLMADLLGSAKSLGEERLAQEAALIVARSDIREELDRLAAHSIAARELIEAGGAIGRRLDFLCQEFNREANTLCSKAANVELTRIGLDLKAAIERLREQVQNIE